MDRWGRILALGALAAASASAQGAPRASTDCTPGPARSETLTGLGPRGEIQFASGARAVIASLRWPDDDGPTRAWLAARIGQAFVVVPRGSPDRWGRERIDADPEDGDIDVAGSLVSAGLALADPGEMEALCRPSLRLVEAAARARGLGVWRDPLLSAEDGAALRRLAGHFAVVEGRVRHVGERSARTYLDFVPRGADGLTVTVTKRTWRTLLAQGITAAALRDRRLRVRGLVEVWRGPTIEAATPDAIEILENDAPVPQDGSVRDDSGVRR